MKMIKKFTQCVLTATVYVIGISEPLGSLCSDKCAINLDNLNSEEFKKFTNKDDGLKKIYKETYNEDFNIFYGKTPHKIIILGNHLSSNRHFKDSNFYLIKDSINWDNLKIKGYKKVELSGGLMRNIIQDEFISIIKSESNALKDKFNRGMHDLDGDYDSLFEKQLVGREDYNEKYNYLREQIKNLGLKVEDCIFLFVVQEISSSMCMKTCICFVKK